MSNKAMKNTVTYIIYAPPYDENSGGSIVLHKLCHELNKLGEKSFLWPFKKKLNPSLSRRIKSIWKNDFSVNPHWKTPIAKKENLTENSIVIYPEIISGNPLNAKNVVRWLLHIPGFHTKKYFDFSNCDQFFFFTEYCLDNPALPKISPENRLFVFDINKHYTDDKNYERNGSCYMLRKGSNKNITHDLTNSICVDNLAHAEMAETFKKSKYFYCYDELTLYSQYAALCGCISVVIPDKGGNRDVWEEKNPAGRFGVAYGTENIEHAINTMHKLRLYFEHTKEESIASIKNFVISSKSRIQTKS